MLHLSFSADIEFLAAKMRNQLQSIWKKENAFESPQVIFPDRKIEQWFRLFWVKEFNVLANLNSIPLERFLWEALKPQEASQLSVDVLQHIINAALLEKDKNDQAFYIRLGLKDKIDPLLIHSSLSFLSAQLASLFLEYEYSRPSNFITQRTGILEHWSEKSNTPFFSENPAQEDPIEKWQRQLYSKVFHKLDSHYSFFDLAILKAEDDGITKPLSLSYLYSQITEEEKALYWTGKDVFLFGLGGLSQFHRTILQDMSKYMNLYVYIQNPCAEFWEDIKVQGDYRRSFQKKEAHDFFSSISHIELDQEEQHFSGENSLLVQWGKAGRDNIKLWSLASDYNFEYEYIEKKPTSLLEHLQKSVLDRKEKLEQSVEADDSLKIMAAPTPIREIENLKEEIWRDLQKKPQLRLDDILVLCPNIDEYRASIEIVFNRESKEKDEYLDYAFVDAPENESLVADAIFSLLNMAQQKEINRKFLFQYLKNPLVQITKKIDPLWIPIWESWVDQLNAYRNTDSADKEKVFSFSHALKRLLLHHLMQNKFTIGDVNYHPYGNIDSENKESLESFVNVVRELDDFVFNTEPDQVLHKTKNYISKLSTHKASKEMSFYGEKEVKKTALKSLNSLSWQNYAGRTEAFSIEEIKALLQRELVQVKPGSGQLLNSGISFMKFQETRILPMKHIYIIGLNAKTFPGSNPQSTLDLRNPIPGRKPRWYGDSNILDKNRYAFLCQIMSCKEKLYLSYQSHNLKKDEILYPSSVVEDLIRFIKKSNLKKLENAESIVKIIPLDENRALDKIYSSKRLQQVFLQSIHKDLKKTPRLQNLKAMEIGSEISIYSLRDFVLNPFEFQVKQSLHLDQEEDSTLETLEPIELNSLKSSIFYKEYFQAHLEQINDKLKGNSDILNETNASLDLFLQNQTEQGILAEGIFGELQMRQTRELYKIHEDKLLESKDSLQSIEAAKEFSYELTYQGKEIQISAKPDFEGLYNNEKCFIFISKNIKNNKISDRNKILLRLNSLLYLAQIKDPHSINTVYEYRLDNKADIIPLSLSPSKAQEILLQLITMAYQERFALYLPFSNKEKVLLDFSLSKDPNSANPPQNWAENFDADIFTKKIEPRDIYTKELCMFDETDWGYHDHSRDELLSIRAQVKKWCIDIINSDLQL